MQSAYQFFYDNAAFSYNPAVGTQEQGRQRCAARIAAIVAIVFYPRGE